MNMAKLRHTGHHCAPSEQEFEELYDIGRDIVDYGNNNIVSLGLAMVCQGIDRRINAVLFGPAGTAADSVFSVKHAEWAEVKDRMEELKCFGPRPAYTEIVYPDFQFTMVVIAPELVPRQVI